MPTKLWEMPSESDLQQLAFQLQRPARDVLAVTARCVCGRPVAIATLPRLTDGTPFPTLYYLTDPAATAAASRLEASGWMRIAEEQLAASEEQRRHYLAAHLSYLQDRSNIAEVAEISGISAGGMPTRVKCLHALVAHSLAAGTGVNPVGDAALAAMDWGPGQCHCTSID